MGNRWTSERRHATMTPSKNSESGGGAKVGWNDDKSSTAPELRTCAVTEPIGSVSRQPCSEITPTDGDIRRITIYRSYASKMAPPPEAETELRPNRSSSTGARFETDVWRSLGHAYKLYKLYKRWLGSRVVSLLDSGAERPGFKSQPWRCRVTVLGKLFTPIVPLFTKQQNW